MYVPYPFNSAEQKTESTASSRTTPTTTDSQQWSQGLSYGSSSDGHFAASSPKVGEDDLRRLKFEDGGSRSDNPNSGSQCKSVMCSLDHSLFVMTSSPSTGNRIFGTLPLPRDVEHRIHEFLRIAEVCALKGVSKTWHVQVRDALRHKYMWDLTHIEGVDGAAHIWLEHISKAGVKTRSLRVVRVSVLSEQ